LENHAEAALFHELDQVSRTSRPNYRSLAL
jgi:hypothetical protein